MCVCSIIVKTVQKRRSLLWLFSSISISFSIPVWFHPLMYVSTESLIDFHLPLDNWISCEIRGKFRFYWLMTIAIDFQVWHCLKKRGKEINSDLNMLYSQYHQGKQSSATTDKRHTNTLFLLLIDERTLVANGAEKWLLRSWPGYFLFEPYWQQEAT